ncbi:dihydroneopterin aldolase [Arthrobacter sp. H20]|uniref:dihydroneopterin aldolase n=1 Tax=Arthrobacter sp. H20 TaxID=1267981 RepID=UPI00047B0942|nr:dihydroneopterin aldolase [Arthrobacter sp. H20]
MTVVAQDTITITGVTAVGFHGVFDFERREGQPFVVDVVLHLDLRPAGNTDDLTTTAHYGDVAEQVVAAITGAPLNLIEALAERIAVQLLASFPASTVEVTVHKPQAPIPVPFDDVAVRIVRDRIGQETP